jgi:hypothetical protein
MEDLLRNNLIFISDIRIPDRLFGDRCGGLLSAQAGFVWLDPILVIRGRGHLAARGHWQFFRNWLNPILRASGVACFCIHHTGKPPSDKSRAGSIGRRRITRIRGLGSSDLTNWARAVMVLQDRGHGVFELKLAKRGLGQAL